MGRVTIFILDKLKCIFMGLGIVLIFSPFVLYWFIHGDHERYMWIISGPYPFDRSGSGPLQLFMYITLALLGICSIIISVVLTRTLKNRL